LYRETSNDKQDRAGLLRQRSRHAKHRRPITAKVSREMPSQYFGGRTEHSPAKNNKRHDATGPIKSRYQNFRPGVYREGSKDHEWLAKSRARVSVRIRGPSLTFYPSGCSRSRAGSNYLASERKAGNVYTAASSEGDAQILNRLARPSLRQPTLLPQKSASHAPNKTLPQLRRSP
jgi:hypothetical protein